MKLGRKMGYLTLVLSFAMLGIGILQNQHKDTWEKAIRICLECIGIG